jgi:hypothetical protein
MQQRNHHEISGENIENENGVSGVKAKWRQNSARKQRLAKCNGSYWPAQMNNVS